ncbi:hypothetical protein AN480_29470 [Mycobacterium intracellulare subsp. chimaera]|nr:hypothetical protein AN480_29470 [Mycobacterium intracellulare subsp. chimaera]
MTVGQQFDVGWLQVGCMHEGIEPNHRCGQALSPTKVERRARRRGQAHPVARAYFVVVQGVAVHDDAPCFVAAGAVELGRQPVVDPLGAV